ncbi:protein rolling stone-like isoform X2 [Plodia interpunctella]|uniref:protein rolling stone-like isoform X2 n=1 Tax=Plodia interpunctella TaxID=58824 RepID=UPI002367DD15|nr:protein rolling stone-like isoform X2 [Plodia interpunctella]
MKIYTPRTLSLNHKTKTISLSDVWVSSNDKLSDFYASSWQRGDSPVPLLVVRLLLAALALAVLSWTLVEGGNEYWPLFLTNWGLVLINAMLLSGILVSIVALFNPSYETSQLPWYVSMYWFFFNIAISTSFLITALYWILLYNPDPDPEDPLFWLDVATHGLNSCIALAEVVASRTPVRALHFYQPLSVGLWYAAFTAIYFAAGGTDGNGNPYIYPVLDWRFGWRTTALVACSCAGLLVIYAALWGVALCRDKISMTIRTVSLDLPMVPDSMQARIV